MIEILLTLLVSGFAPLDSIDFTKTGAQEQRLVFCSAIPESARSVCMRTKVTILDDYSMLIQAIGEPFVLRAGDEPPPFPPEEPSLERENG